MRLGRRLISNQLKPLKRVYKIIFTISGSFVVPETGGYYVRCLSGGSGGGGYISSTSNRVHGGGGAVNEVNGVLSLLKGQIISVIVGAGGAAGTNVTQTNTSAGAGSAGGDTIFSTITAVGALGGGGASYTRGSYYAGAAATGTYSGGVPQNYTPGSITVDGIIVSGGAGGIASLSSPISSKDGTSGLVYIERILGRI
jgi:hypothetical protein